MACYCYSSKFDFLFKAKTPTKRVRIGKMPPSEKAVAKDPMKGEEAFQISEGKAGLMEVGRRVESNTTQGSC